MKLLFIFLYFFYISLVWPDCIFNIANYANTPVVVEAGFYKGVIAIATVNTASSKTIKIKNNLNCNSVSDTGLGVTYLNLVSGKSSGNWVYIPQANMIRAIGQLKIGKDTVLGIAPNGEKLILFNKLRANLNSFDVRIEKAGRNISRQLGSMN